MYASSFLFKKFLLFLGIKNILVYCILIFLFSPNLLADNGRCFKIPPFGYNEYYVHLPVNFSFCVRNGKEIIDYKTGPFGERILFDNQNFKYVYVFGDSQALGLDVNNINQHFLGKVFKNKNLKLFAAPNNGPNQVLEFLKIHNKQIQNNSEINIVFNGSTDLFRLSLSWDPKRFVLFNDIDLEEIKDNRFFYNYKLIKGLFSSKFTYRRPNTSNLQNSFIKNIDDINNNFTLYLNKIDKLKYKKINLYIVLPFWIYEEKKNTYTLNKFIFNNFSKSICNINSSKYKNLDIFVQLNDINLSKTFLTYDRRHIKSDLINLTNLKNFCNF